MCQTVSVSQITSSEFFRHFPPKVWEFLVRGVARNLFWGYKSFLGGIKLLNSPSALLTYLLPHKKFTWADLGGYKYQYPPRRYAPVISQNFTRLLHAYHSSTPCSLHARPKRPVPELTAKHRIRQTSFRRRAPMFCLVQASERPAPSRRLRRRLEDKFEDLSATTTNCDRRRRRDVRSETDLRRQSTRRTAARLQAVVIGAILSRTPPSVCLSFISSSLREVAAAGTNLNANRNGALSTSDWKWNDLREDRSRSLASSSSAAATIK